MAKEVFKITAECFSANKTKNGSTITFANNVQQTDKGIGSREAVNVVLPDPKTAGSFEPGKKYLISFSEI